MAGSRDEDVTKGVTKGDVTKAVVGRELTPRALATCSREFARHAPASSGGREVWFGLVRSRFLVSVVVLVCACVVHACQACTCTMLVAGPVPSVCTCGAYTEFVRYTVQ